MVAIEKPPYHQPYLSNLERCPACHGAGVIAPPDYARATTCPDCHGSGLSRKALLDLPLNREPDTSKEW